MVINLNMNQQMQAQKDFNMIGTVCKSQKDCLQCPVYINNGLHTNQSIVYCHKVEEKLMKENQNGKKPS